jgi:hypothetical protein
MRQPIAALNAKTLDLAAFRQRGWKKNAQAQILYVGPQAIDRATIYC